MEMSVVQVANQAPKKKKKNNIWFQIWRNRQTYILLLPGMVWLAIFAYIPMYGLTLAFRQYSAKLGIMGSPWIGLGNYERVFRDPAFFASIRTTLTISLSKTVFVFPIAIILALLINEMRTGKYKKILQTIFTFPHFLSWVIVASIITNLLGDTGVFNTFLFTIGVDRITILGDPAKFRPMLYITDAWKTAGWSSIIYLASIAGIDTEQYESAMLDGATRMQRMIYITLPGIKATIVVLLIMNIGSIMNAGFDQIFQLRNAATRSVAETIDMYIHRITFEQSADYSFSTAISLFRSVVNFIMLVLADRVAKLFGETGLFA